MGCGIRSVLGINGSSKGEGKVWDSRHKRWYIRVGM